MRTQAQDRARYTYLRTSEVAATMAVSRTHVAELVKTGAFPDVEGEPGAIDVSIGGRPEYRIHPESLAALLRERKVA